MRPTVLLMLFALSACNGAPLATQWKLRSFDLNTADLSQLRLAVRGPDWATPTPESAAIEARYWFGDDEAAGRSFLLKLHRGAHAGDTEALAQLGGSPALVVYELAPQSLGPAHDLQTEAVRLKAQGQTHGKLHVDGAIACRRADIPPGPLAIDAFVHADDETGWLPLYAQYDVRGDMKDPRAEAELARLIPPCVDKRKGR
jgi:hypothetical protein